MDGRAGYLMKMAWGLTVSPADIEDAVQEARIAIWRKPDADWRFVARNRMIDCVRKWYGRKAQALSRNDYTGVKRNHSTLEDVQVEAPDLFAAAESRVVLTELMGRARLSQAEGAVIAGLRRGSRCSEVARVLGVSSTYIYQVRDAALKKLRRVV